MIRTTPKNLMAAAAMLCLIAAAPLKAQEAPATGPQVEPAPGRPAQPPQPQVPQFESIFEVDAEGIPMAPETWNDLAALAVNPEISADQREAIEAGVREWLAGVQKLVLENPDLALEAAKGLFADVDIDARAELAHASEVMKTLSAVSNLSSSLSNAGIVTNEQAQLNRRIVQEYVRARSTALSDRVMGSGGEPAEQQREMQVMMARVTMTSLTDDAMRMFRSVAVRGAPFARAALEDSGMDASAYSTHLEAIQNADSDDAKVEAMVALMDSIPTRELFQFAGSLGPKLPPVDLPQIAMIGTAPAETAGDG
ncbi:MAG: hypothetical protein ACFCBV_00825 [Phycisphaerales bacterium]